MAGYILMAAGGPAVAFPMFSLPALLPKKAGMVFSLIVGAFDGSAAIMLLFRVLYDTTGVSTHLLFSVYLVFPGLLIFACPFIFSREIPFLKSKEDKLEDKQLLASTEETQPSAPPDTYFPSLTTLKNILPTKEFWIIAAWGSCYVTAKYFFLENVNLQLEWITGGDDDKVNVGTYFISIVLPCAAIFAPITSYLLDKVALEVSVLLLAFFSLIIATLGVVHVFPVQFPVMLAVVFNRYFYFACCPFLFSKMYGEIGPTTIYGIANFISGVSNVSNFLWSYLVVEDPSNFYFLIPVLNGVCVVMGLIVAVNVRMWRQAKEKQGFSLN